MAQTIISIYQQRELLKYLIFRELKEIITKGKISFYVPFSKTLNKIKIQKKLLFIHKLSV